MMGVYLLLNLTVAVSYGAFALVASLGQRLSPRTGQLTWLRCGQLLLLFSLVSPLVAPHIPRTEAEQRVIRVLPPLPEMNKGGTRPASLTKLPTPALRHAEKVLRSSPQSVNYLIAVLLLGFIIALVLKCRSAFHLSRLLRDSIKLRTIGKVIVAASSDFHVPISTSLGLRAWVIVPESIVGNCVDYQIAVRHELQHHRQRDTAWALGIEVLTTLFFLNPFIYAWKRRITEFQELSCDEALIGRKVPSFDYGSCLLRVATAALENRQVLVGTAGMAAGLEHPRRFKSFLARRIEMLSQHDKTRPRRWAGLVVGTLTMASTFTLAVAAQRILSKGGGDLSTAGEVLTDPQIQKIADSALESALKRHRASLGFIIVTDPKTGQILAVANKDIIEMQTKRSSHWSLSLRVGPASLTKAIVAAAAVDKGVTSFSEIHNCENAKYTLAGKLFQDWKAFDKLTTAETVIHSSNICGIKVGEKLGVAGLQETFKNFGFGPGGSAENFPEARVGEMASLDSTNPALYVATLSTGYGGLFLSPIEIVQAFGALANGGNLLRPQSTRGRASPIVVRRVLSEATAQQTKEVLANVLTEGTARQSGSKLYRLAGKTATGYSHSHVGHDTLGGESNMASFVGFGPVENPKVLVYVGIENPTDGKGVHGAYHAAPVFREVAEKTLQYLKVPTL